MSEIKLKVHKSIMSEILLKVCKIGREDMYCSLGIVLVTKYVHFTTVHSVEFISWPISMKDMARLAQTHNTWIKVRFQH